MRRFMSAILISLFFSSLLVAEKSHMGIPVDGNLDKVIKSSIGKAPNGMVVIGPLGYADAWRTIAPGCAKSIASSRSGDSLMVLYSQYSGSVSTPSNLTLSYSTNGGNNWYSYPIVTNRNSRTYSALAPDYLFTPYIIWQDRVNSTSWPISITYDKAGFAGGMLATPVYPSDSGIFYLPNMSVYDDGMSFKLICSAFPHPAFGGDASLFMALTSDRALNDWEYPWDIDNTWGWDMWYDTPNNDQDNADWIFSPSGDTVFAFWEETEDTISSNYRPIYRISTDGGITWGPANILAVAGSNANGHPYQYTDGGWWYRYDGCWVGDRPHLLYAHSDGVWNGVALFEYHPTMAGDFTEWTCTRISEIPGNLAGVYDGDLIGSDADFPSISYDQYGNIFATYVGYSDGSNNTKDIIGVASTDGGNTWLQHVYLTSDGATCDYRFIEAAEYAGGDKIHLIVPTEAMDSLYYLSVPTSTLLSAPTRPCEIDLAPLLCGSSEGGIGGPVDAIMDTVNNDTLNFIWGPMIGIDGWYSLTISKTPDWYDGGYYFRSALTTNYAQKVNGLPETGVVWYYKVRSQVDCFPSPWSEVYDFFYNGTASMIDWPVHGVTGKPTVSHPFVLSQNRPNPVNGDTKISFSLPMDCNYCIKIFNVTGQIVDNISGHGNAGNNTATWNSRNVSNGVYFYQLNAVGSTATRRMVVIK